MEDPKEEKRKANIEPYQLAERERILELCEAIQVNMYYNMNGCQEVAKIRAKEIIERCKLVDKMKNHERRKNNGTTRSD